MFEPWALRLANQGFGVPPSGGGAVLTPPNVRTFNEGTDSLMPFKWYETNVSGVGGFNPRNDTVQISWYDCCIGWRVAFNLVRNAKPFPQKCAQFAIVLRGVPI
jgi:hypothetical protein